MTTSKGVYFEILGTLNGSVSKLDQNIYVLFQLISYLIFISA